MYYNFNSPEMRSMISRLSQPSNILFLLTPRFSLLQQISSASTAAETISLLKESQNISQQEISHFINHFTTQIRGSNAPEANNYMALTMFSKLIESRMVPESTKRDLQVSEIENLAYIIYSLKVRGENTRLLASLNSLLRGALYKRIIDNEEPIGKLAGNLEQLARYYVVIHIAAATIRYNLMRDISKELMNHISRLRKPAPAQIDLLLQVLNTMSNKSDYVKQEPLLAENIILFMEKAQNSLSVLDKIKLYFYVYENKNLMRNKTRNFVLKIGREMQAQLPKLALTLDQDAFLYYVTFCPTYNYVIFVEVYKKVINNWAASLDLRQYKSYSDLTLPMNILLAINKNKQGVNAFTTQQRAIELLFLHIIHLTKSSEEVDKFLPFWRELSQGIFFSSKFLEALAPELLHHPLLSQQIDIIYAFALHNIFDQRLIPILADKPLLKVTEWKKRDVKMANLKYACTISKYSSKYKESNLPELEIIRVNSIKLKNQTKSLSDSEAFQGFLKGIQYEIRLLECFHHQFGTYFFQSLVEEKHEEATIIKIVIYCLAVCNHSDLQRVLDIYKDSIQINALVKILKVVEIYERILLDKFLQNVMTMIKLFMPKFWEVSMTDVQSFSLLSHFLTSNIVLQSVTLFKSKTLFSVLTEISQYKKYSLSQKVAIKSENIIQNFLSKNFEEPRRAIQFPIFLQNLQEQLPTYGNHALIRPIFQFATRYNVLTPPVARYIESRSNLQMSRQDNKMLLQIIARADTEQPYPIWSLPTAIIQNNLSIVLSCKYIPLKKMISLQPLVSSIIEKMSQRQLYISLINYSLPAYNNEPDETHLLFLHQIINRLNKISNIPDPLFKNYFIRKLRNLTLEYNLFEDRHLRESSSSLRSDLIDSMKQFIIGFQKSHSKHIDRIEQLNITIHFDLIDLALAFGAVDQGYLHLLLTYFSKNSFTFDPYLKLFAKVSSIFVVREPKHFEIIQKKMSQSPRLEENLFVLLGYYLLEQSKIQNPQAYLLGIIQSIRTIDSFSLAFLQKICQNNEDIMEKLQSIPLNTKQYFVRDSTTTRHLLRICGGEKSAVDNPGCFLIRHLGGEQIFGIVQNKSVSECLFGSHLKFLKVMASVVMGIPAEKIVLSYQPIWNRVLSHRQIRNPQQLKESIDKQQQESNKYIWRSHKRHDTASKSGEPE